MDRAYVRLPAELGKVVEISAVAASKRKLNLLPYICPECTERLYLIQAGNGFFRNPFFRHRKKKECIVQECSERVYASPGIMSPTQKEHPRTPIFLYKKKEGSFALAVALTGKIKKKLAKQQYRQFVEYQMLCGNEIKAQAPISILLNSPQADFVDLHNTVPKKAQFASYLRKENGETRSLEEFLGLSPKLLDTFASSSCSGAMFRIVTNGVYEKLPTGSFITSKQKYIILDKITNPTKRLNNNFEAYNVKVQELGLAKLKDADAEYSVCSVEFDYSKNTPDYVKMVDYITERYGVILCDESVPWPMFNDLYSLDDEYEALPAQDEEPTPVITTDVIMPCIGKAYGSKKHTLKYSKY